MRTSEPHAETNENTHRNRVFWKNSVSYKFANKKEKSYA